MKYFHVLECAERDQISKELGHFLYQPGGALTLRPTQFWNNLNRSQTYKCMEQCPRLASWLESMDLRVRDASFTMYDSQVGTTPHVDAPPVVAKINFPVCNTRDTYNVWFDQHMNELARVECVEPIVLRSDVMHTVEMGPMSQYPRVQMSFCFYKEPIGYLE